MADGLDGVHEATLFHTVLRGFDDAFQPGIIQDGTVICDHIQITGDNGPTMALNSIVQIIQEERQLFKKVDLHCLRSHL